MKNSQKHASSISARVSDIHIWYHSSAYIACSGSPAELDLLSNISKLHLLLGWLPSLQEEQQAATDACGKVAEHEQLFWQMAFEG